MIFGCQTEGGSRKLKNYLKPDKDAQRIRRAHDLGYSLNLMPSNSAYEQQPYSKFSSQPSMISLGHLPNRNVPMNYPPGQHIHPQAPHISGFPVPTPWPPFDANVEPDYLHYHHPQSPKCSNCRRDVNLSQSYNKNLNNGHGCCIPKARKCSHLPYRNCSCIVEKDINNYSQLDNSGIRHSCIQEKYYEANSCKKCMNIDNHLEQINCNKPMCSVENIKHCSCVNCEPESQFPNFNKCQHNCNIANKQNCSHKTHVPNCVKYQNLRSNVHTHDQLPTQHNHYTELPQEIPGKNTHIFKKQEQQECCNSKPQKLYGLNSVKDNSQNAQCTVTPIPSKPKSAFVSPFKCPNCSYSCILNITSTEKNPVDKDLCFINKTEDKFCDNYCADQTEPIVTPECEHRQYVFKYPSSVKETCNEEFRISELVENDQFNSDCSKTLVNFNEDIISKDHNSFDYANCIGNTSRNEIVTANPILQVSAFHKEQQNQQPVFLNVLQKEEVIWFSS